MYEVVAALPSSVVNNANAQYHSDVYFLLQGICNISSNVHYYNLAYCPFLFIKLKFCSCVLTCLNLNLLVQNELCADTPCESGYTDYISFQVPDEAFPDIQNCIGIAKGFKQNSNNQTNDYTSLEAVLLSVPSGYHCVDLSLYKVNTHSLPQHWLIIYLLSPICHLVVPVSLSLSCPVTQSSF